MPIMFIRFVIFREEQPRPRRPMRRFPRMNRDAARKPSIPAPKNHLLNGIMAAALVAVLVLIGIEAYGTVTRPRAGTPTSAPAPDDTPVKLNKPEPPGPAPEGMVWVPGGEFWMGTDDGPPDQQPRHRLY